MTRSTGRLFALTLLIAAVCFAGSVRAADHSLGLGLHYWQSLDELAKDFPGVEDSGVSWLASYQADPVGLFKFVVDLEYFPDGFGGSTDNAFAPQAYVLVGGNFYGGVGVGTTFSSSFDGNASDAYYIGRLGLDFTLVPRIKLDVNLTYQADAFNELDEFESDALTLGAVVRFKFSKGDD